MLKTALVRASLAALSGCFSSEAKPDALKLTNWRRRSCGGDVVTLSHKYIPLYIHSIGGQKMFDSIYMHLLSRKVVKVVNVRGSSLRIHDNAVRETWIRREVEV